MATNTAKMITLESADGVKFVVPEAVAMQSRTIRHLINRNCIPQIKIDSRILAKVFEYCTKHVSVAEKSADFPKLRRVVSLRLRRLTRCHPMMTSNSKAKKTEEGTGISASHAETPDMMSPKDELRLMMTSNSKAKKTEEGTGTGISASHAETPDTMSPEDELKKWDAEFLNINNDMLYNLISAADYLNIKGLLDLTCEKAANMIKEKSPEELREMLGIQNDFTPEEEEEIRRENAWAFN